MSIIKAKINKWEEQQKKLLIDLGNSEKPYSAILPYLEGEIKKSTQMCKVNYKIRCFKNDGVYQLNKAIEEVYGVSNSEAKSGPSGESAKIETVDVQLADGSRVKVPYGTISLPEAGEGASININYDTSRNELIVSGSCQFRFSSMIDDIVERTKELLTTSSIYRSQAIELSSDYIPKIMDLSSIEKEFMVLSDKTEYDLQPLLARLTNPKKCIEKGISLKYGCLMEGAYGTGKTLLAFKLARQAIKNNWIFIYLKDPSMLATTLRLAHVIDKNGSGVVIFVEDIDQVTKGNRTTAMQDILNTLDGGDTKQMNVISLFTTNHIELIEPTFLRGKRIGTIISLGFLDAKTSEKFIHESFGKDGYSVDQSDNWDEIYKYIEKSNIAPAFMAEIVESVKSHMILTEEQKVKAFHIKHSVDSYLRQVELSKKKDMSETPEIKLTSSLKEVLFGDFFQNFSDLDQFIREQYD